MQYKLNESTLFEVSWEVCNKVGGIYTVVSSKALEAVAHFGENYYLIGPDFGNNAEFEVTDEPCWRDIAPAIQQRGLQCRFGRWNIPGRPKVILVNFRDHYNQDQLLFSLWTHFGVDSISGSWDYIEPVMFSTACGEIIAAASKVCGTSGPTLAHFHEWMCGAGLLYLKQNNPEVGTVFTTHATMLGRAMAGAGFDIYKQMNQINPKRESENYNIIAKHSMESTSAREADCFTTVSRITADEATAFLGRTPDVLTFNGLDLQNIPDASAGRAVAKRMRKRLFDSVGKLLRRPIPENTRVFVISGRYEFHNKGLNLFLDALSQVNTGLASTPNTSVLAVCSVMGGHSGVNPDAINGDPNKYPEGGGNWITSHYVYNQQHDPILTACQRLNLRNSPEDRVQVIFNPAQLNGQDGFLNMTYDELLSACDLGVFPSWYEPWGYTPQESAAHAVPTVTTDLAGFGHWVRGLKTTSRGVEIIARRQIGYDESAKELRNILLEYATMEEGLLDQRRANVREVSEQCTWKNFFPYYAQAYQTALAKEAERAPKETDESDAVALERVMTAVMSTAPHLYSFSVSTNLPDKMNRLREIAHNIWWAWHPDAQALFAEINPQEWVKSGHNPIAVLEHSSRERLEMLVSDSAWRRRYASVCEEFDEYMQAKPISFGNLTPEAPLAYFSTEYGLTECLPIYSGGLGVLSGDHLKSASDLNIPLVGVGLLYKSGYFEQRLDGHGRQVPLYPQNDFSLLPVEKVLDERGEQLDVSLDIAGRRIFANVWLVRVGRIKLYLMDTDTPRNREDDRIITARLYEADRDLRLRQEILLGMGGVKMLNKLKIRAGAFHMNEGHSAFLIFERIRELMLERGLSFKEAEEVVRGSTLFTTHTPVDAGNERFDLDRMEVYFRSYAQSIGISWQDFVKIGHYASSERNVFEMTVLALNYAYRSNGVSELHGHVSRRMWQAGWPSMPLWEIPIGHVTNGIHVPSYVGPGIRPILEGTLGKSWEEQALSQNAWDSIAASSDDMLWTTKQYQKKLLIEYIRNRLPSFCKRLNVPYEYQKIMDSHLSADSLIIGFARRFAPYKRATLLFADIDRLKRILSKENRPVIFVFAGKAHPADVPGIDIMQEVVRHSIEPDFLGKIFFVENYNLDVSHALVQGCDVWLNTPRRPHEASGTSGQKVAVNFGLNLSISDGWWCEGYNGQNGWTIGGEASPQYVPDQSDYDDADSLYTLLEENVIPMFFDRDSKGMPRSWLNAERQAIKTLVMQYSSHRMVNDYVREYYQPAADRHAQLQEKGFALARRLAAWKSDVAKRFDSLKMGSISVEGLATGKISSYEDFEVTVEVMPGQMDKSELLVQLVVGVGDGNTFTSKPDVVNLAIKEDGKDRLIYSGKYAATSSGNHMYGVRIVPVTEGIDSYLDTRLVVWG